MSWNYRIIQKNVDEFVSFEVHEVYYRPDGSIEGWSENPVIPYGETPEELKKDLTKMLQAFEKPILTQQDLSRDP